MSPLARRDRVALGFRHLPYRLLDQWALGQHLVEADGPNVGDVDVNGQPGQVEHEEVDGGAAVHGHLPGKHGMLAEPLQQVQQPLDLVYRSGIEPL